MKFFCISDNIDTQMGMRLAGIEGVVVHEYDETMDAIHQACQNQEIGIVLISEKLVKLCSQTVLELKMRTKFPLIVEIPDRHGTADVTDSITKYVQEAIGIKLQ